MLVVVTLMVRFAEPAGLYPDFRMSALSALFYFSNWWQIAASSNYFVATGAGLAPHPHLVPGRRGAVLPGLAAGGAGGDALLAAPSPAASGSCWSLSVLGAVASALEMALLYSPMANTTRLYFGTDTHAQSILVGSVLACSMTIIQMRRGAEGMAPVARSLVARWGLVLLGLAGLAGTLTLTYTLVGTSSFDYRGGFMLSALSAAAIITAAVCVPRGPIARGLSLRPAGVARHHLLWGLPVALPGLHLPRLRPHRPVRALPAGRPLRLHLRPGHGQLLPGRAPGHVRHLLALPQGRRPRHRPAGRHRGGGHRGHGGTGHRGGEREAVPGAVCRTPSPRWLVVLGDSTALTLGAALGATAPPGTTVVNGGLFGCGLAIATNASNTPPQLQLAMFPACNEASPAAKQWPAVDTQAVAGTAPGDLVLFVAGSWEVQDLLRNGQWTNIEEPSFQRYELSQMRKAVEIGIAHGAHFDFTTMPALAAGAAFHEAPFPEDSSARRLIYDQLITKVADRIPRLGERDRLRQTALPQGVFTEYLDGVQVRTADGVHTPAYSPGNAFVGNSTASVAHAFYNWLAPRIWPLIIDSNPSAADTASSQRQSNAGHR